MQKCGSYIILEREKNVSVSKRSVLRPSNLHLIADKSLKSTIKAAYLSKNVVVKQTFSVS